MTNHVKSNIFSPRGEKVFEEFYKEDKINSIEDLDEIIADLMINYGPDGHCDGSDILATVIWRLMKQ